MPSTKAILVTAALAFAVVGCGSDQDLAERQEAVAEAGAEVMPFPLDETTHIFTDTQSGGRQDVVAGDPTDEDTVEAIREHLAEEAAKFQVGDFSDPEAIHGSAMPGLAALKAGFDQIDVQLLETTTGAAITYSTQDPEMVSAIHLWFEAQTSDHGSHAEHNP